MPENESRPVSAAALKYRPPEDSAPRLVARGRGEIAERILDLAREHNIPIHEDPDMIAVLSQLDLDKEIPLKQLAAIVKEVLGEESTPAGPGAAPPPRAASGAGPASGV